MGEKSRIRFIIGIALILAAAVVYSFTANSFERVPAVGLAEVDPGPEDGSGVPDPLEDMMVVEVTPDTVQGVIASLNRYASYWRTVTVEYFSGEAAIGTLTASVAVDGDWTRCDVTEGNGRTEHTIVGDGVRWLWYDQDDNYVELSAEGAMSDLVQRIPTYEDILAIDRERIIHADYEWRGELPCIYVETSLPELNYLERFWVSVESGLLVSSETVKDGEVIYRMSSYEVESPLTDAGDSFTLPDGTVLHQAEG